MSTNKLSSCLAAILLVGCDGTANGGAHVPEPIHVRIGMNVGQFNSQAAVARHGSRLDSKSESAVKIGEHHVLALDVNGRTTPFDAGGQNSFTYVSNTFYVPHSVSDYGKVSSVDFDIGRELMTLAEAVKIARDSCSAMRATGLPAKDHHFGVISETFKSGANRPVATEAELVQAFADDNVAARTVVLCHLRDEYQEFHLEITKSPYASGDKAFRVSGHLAQNMNDPERGAAGRSSGPSGEMAR